MGKASKRRHTRSAVGASASSSSRPEPAPFVARPFAGLPSETEWVAIREIVPAATAPVTFAKGAAPAGAAPGATIATVLPLAWPGLHRSGGEVFVATQSGMSSGDASRDLAAALLLAAGAEEGTPVTSVPTPDSDSPRLQDLLDLDAPFDVTIHEGFDFWVGDAELDDEGRESLAQANGSAIPTARVDGVASAYWCVINGRSYVRWVLPHDEDRATDALARLIAADTAPLVEESRLLGAFRACGLIVPVWEVSTAATAPDFSDPVVALEQRLGEALAETGPLTADERRARAGLVNRQMTLR